MHIKDLPIWFRMAIATRIQSGWFGNISYIAGDLLFIVVGKDFQPRHHQNHTLINHDKREEQL